MNGLSIVLASERDIDRVMTLVAACIADMRSAGIEQWDDVYPDRQMMLQDARDGSLYLASVDQEPLVGTLVVNDVQSPEYLDVPWTMTGDRIAVVHRLMTEPVWKGSYGCCAVEPAGGIYPSGILLQVLVGGD